LVEIVLPPSLLARLEAIDDQFEGDPRRAR
jgi:hypothetical protein